VDGTLDCSATVTGYRDYLGLNNVEMRVYAVMWKGHGSCFDVFQNAVLEFSLRTTGCDTENEALRLRLEVGTKRPPLELICWVHAKSCFTSTFNARK
jgi:hypothetical protein